MAYETLLTVTPAISSSNGVTGFSITNGLSASILLNIGNTTLGNNLSDDVARILLNTVPDSTGVALSAAIGTPVNTINLTLSSPTALPVAQLYPATIATSTFKSGVSATITLTFPGRELTNTSISLSANASTLVLDPTLTSTLDNFFFLTGSPDTKQQVRTTGGNAKLQAYLG